MLAVLGALVGAGRARLHAGTQQRSNAVTSDRSRPECRDSTRPVASHTSAQFMVTPMQRTNSPASGSLTHASAHAVHA
ncbi:hypothetical protein [Nocardia farcinica]|uniref:hypothetical protein n=1 Tax=Nocardia farcinica TaxID=37329 RepID=UPI00313AC701